MSFRVFFNLALKFRQSAAWYYETLMRISMVLFSKVMQMIIIEGFSFLHICVDIYLYLVLVQTEGNINNHMFQYVLCFTTLKFISVLLSYLAQNQNEKQKPKKNRRICSLVSNQQ